MRTLTTIAAILAASSCLLAGDEGVTVPIKGTYNAPINIPGFVPATTTKEPTVNVVTSGDTESNHVKGDPDDPDPVTISIRGPKTIEPGSYVFAAIVTAPDEAKIEWQISPDPGKEHREIGKLGPGKFVLLFIEPPQGEYTIVAIAKIILPGEDGIGIGWLTTTVGKPAPPTPIVIDTDGDGIPDKDDPCPTDPQNLCDDPNPPPPTPQPVTFDSAVIVLERTDVSPEHAILLSDLPFWRELTGNKYKVYDTQDPEVVSKGYAQYLQQANVQPPAIVLLQGTTPVKAGTLPDTKAAVKTFVGK